MQKQVIVILNKLKIFLTIVLVGLAVSIGLLVTKVVPTIQNIAKIKTDYKQAKDSIVDKERQLKELEEKQKEEESTTQSIEKTFFKSIERDADTESVISNEFAEIFELMKAHTIKTHSIKYEYDPQDDNFVKSAANKYNVAKLDMEMIASYKQFEGFLKELYKHEHFLDISSIEIVPYNKDKKILIIKFQLKLYAQKQV